MARKFLLIAAVALFGLTSSLTLGSGAASAQGWYYHPYGYGWYHGWGYRGYSYPYYGYGYRYPHCWYNYYGQLVCN